MRGINRAKTAATKDLGFYGLIEVSSRFYIIYIYIHYRDLYHIYRLCKNDFETNFHFKILRINEEFSILNIIENTDSA